jgi:ATPase family associated with various cellular activities (AAA)
MPASISLSSATPTTPAPKFGTAFGEKEAKSALIAAVDYFKTGAVEKPSGFWGVMSKINNFGTGLANFTGIFTLASGISTAIVNPIISHHFQKKIHAVSHRNNMVQLGTQISGFAGLAMLGSYTWVKAQSWLHGNKIAQDLKGAIEKIDTSKLGNAHFDKLIGHKGVKARLDELHLELDGRTAMEGLPENDQRYQFLKQNLKEGPFQLSFILEGPPGTGKTKMVEAFVNKIQHNTILNSQRRVGLINVGVDKLVAGPGIGPRGVGQLYHEINDSKEDVVVVFLDELSSVASRKKLGEGSEGAKTLAALLQLVEGIKPFKPGKKVIFVGAANYYDDIDPALQRRLKLRLHMGLPNRDELHQIYQSYFNRNNLRAPANLDMTQILDQSQIWNAETQKYETFSGSYVENAVNALKRTLSIKRLKEAFQQQKGMNLSADGKQRFTQEELIQAIQTVTARSNKTNAPPMYSQSQSTTGHQHFSANEFNNMIQNTAGEKDALPAYSPSQKKQHTQKASLPQKAKQSQPQFTKAEIQAIEAALFEAMKTQGLLPQQPQVIPAPQLRQKNRLPMQQSNPEPLV